VLHLSWGFWGWAHYLLGDLRTAQNHIEKAIEIAGNTQVQLALSIFYYWLSFIHHDSGDLKTAQACAEKSLELSQQDNEKGAEGMARCSLGWVLGKMDSSQVGDAEKLFLTGLKIIEDLKIQSWLPPHYFLFGEMYADNNRKEEALEYLNKAMSMCKEMEILYWPDKIQEVLDRL
jgi:tetratricopeptide (TPR) repeat protein